MSLDQVLAELRASSDLPDAYAVERIGVFGSVARGEAGPDSDVDLGVSFRPGRVPGLKFFELQRRLADAVAMNPPVIGEAVGKLPTELKAHFADVPWADVIGLRHRIAHGYDTLEFPLIWSIVRDDLDAIEATLNRMQV